MATLQWASIERGRRRAGRGQRRNYTGIARRFCRAGAPTRANHALFPTFFSLLPTFGSPLQSDHALPSTFFSLPSTFGSPLQSGHALPSTFFSLPSTLVECECGCRDNDWECPDGDAWVVASCDSERHIFAL